MKGLLNKDELKEKLLEFPLLRQLVCERWFRLAFAAFVLVFVFFALFLPKIWTTSPHGFRPVVKVSGLDLVQARSLKRTALKDESAGKFEEANYAWQAALANNQADLNLIRGALRCVLRDPHGHDRAPQALGQASWLLKLTETNIVDLELAAKVFEEFKYHETVITLLTPRTNQLTQPLKAIYLKALFNEGRYGAFNARWSALGAEVEADSELRLYRAAFLAGWGPPGTITEARQQLEAASNDPALRLLAHRLQLVLSARQTDPDGYAKYLKDLEDWREDTLPQHALYWRLLANVGRRSEALRLAHAYSRPPATVTEAVELVQIYWELGLQDEASQLLNRSVDQFGRAPAIWVVYGTLLIEMKRWEDLRNVTVRIRQQEGVHDQLAAFSYFLEGRAELALGRDRNADDAFQKAAGLEFPFPSLGLKVAAQLDHLGRSELARQVLASLEKHLNDESQYWVLVFQVADHLKDVDLLVKAAMRAHDLLPEEAIVSNNYAAALLISRQRPEEAIKLTLPLYAANTNSLYAVVNHSAALLLNDRPKEAEALLSRVRTNGLNRAQIALYNLDLFEAYSSLRQFDRAWAIGDRIETNLLYPPQQKWFAEARMRLPPKPKQK
jgi:hypothetical protein